MGPGDIRFFDEPISVVAEILSTESETKKGGT